MDGMNDLPDDYMTTLIGLLGFEGSFDGAPQSSQVAADKPLSEKRKLVVRVRELPTIFYDAGAWVRRAEVLGIIEANLSEAQQTDDTSRPFRSSSIQQRPSAPETAKKRGETVSKRR